MPRKKLPLRSAPPTSQSDIPFRPAQPPVKVRLRSVPPPSGPRKTIEKKKRQSRISDLTDPLVSRILTTCNANENLRGRSLYTIRQAFSLALTCSRFFTIFRNKLQEVDALYPTSTGYPSPVVPDYVSPTQMTWIARLAQGRLRKMRLPSYTKGTTDVLVAVEYCCHYIQELSFTDHGMVFPNLASSLFTACNMLCRIEIRAPQKSTIQAMWQSVCEFKQIALLDVSTEFLNSLCTMVETKGRHLKALQIAFDVTPRHAAGNGMTRAEERAYERIQDFGDYLTEHALTELPRINVLDISTSPYYVIDHDRWAVLDDDSRPAMGLLKNLRTELCRVREVKKQRAEAGATVRQIKMMRLRCANLDFTESMTLNHLPVNEAGELEVVFPGGSLLFNTNDEKRPKVTSLQLGRHLTHGKECILRENRGIKCVDLGNIDFVAMYDKDVQGIRSKVAKVMLQESGNIRTIRGVFDLSRCAKYVEMAYGYVAKMMKFGMLVTTLDITYEMVLYGHGLDDEFRGMVTSWKSIRTLRLLNPGNYGTGGRRLTEGDCLAFVAGLQWLLVLLPRACPALSVVYVEDLGRCECWKNAPGSRNCLGWAVDAVRGYEEGSCVDCGTLKALLKRWLQDCM